MKHIKKINEEWFKSMLNGGHKQEIDSICRKYSK